MVTPSDLLSGRAAAVVASIATLAGALGSFLTKYKVRSDYHKLTLANKAELERVNVIIGGHTETLAEHTWLHKGYVSMQADVRATRDVVIKIADRMEMDGPK